MQLTRANSAPTAALPTGLGAIAAGFGSGSIVAAVTLGAAVHACANIVNALADVEQDRADPRRRGEPLVSGALTAHQALLLALILLLGIGPAAVALLERPAASITYLAIVGLYIYANLFQKRSAYISPIAMDLAFGVVVAGPIAIVASSSGELPPVALVLLTCSMVLQIAASNVIVGTVKDLECDLRYGVRTSAIELGVRPGDHGPVVSAAFARYAIGLQVAALLAGICAVVLDVPTGPVTIAFAAIGVALLGAGTFNVVTLMTRLRAVVTATSRPWSLQANFLATVAIAAAQLDPTRVCLLLAGVSGATVLSVALSGGRRRSIDRLLRLQDAVVE